MGRSCFVGFRRFGNTFLSFCIHLHLRAFSFIFLSFARMSLYSFQKLWKWLYGLAREPSAINGYRYNPSNIWHCTKEIFHKTTERERERETERERERESELDAKWYGNCRKQGTTGWISLIVFARSVNVHSICLVYANFNGLSCMVPGYGFWGGLSLWSVSCTSLTKEFLQD